MRFWPAKPVETKSLTDPSSDEYAILTGTVPGSGDFSPLSVPAVSAAVRTISEAAASLDLHIVRRDEAQQRVELPVLKLLHGHVSQWLSGFDLIRDLISQALTSDGGGLAWVNRIGGEVREIIRYDTGRLLVQYDPYGTGEPIYRLNGALIPLADVIHVRGAFSKCPVTLARGAIGVAQVLEQHADRLFRNGARPGGVIEFPKGFGETAWRRLKAGWKAAHEGSDNAGKTAVLPDGASFKPLSLNSTDAQFLELRKFQLEEIARAFNLSPAMLGELTKSSYAHGSQAQQQALVYAIEPWLHALEQAFNRALLTDEERQQLTFQFDRDDLTRASLTERATAINSLIASEVINPNTGRDWLGLPAYDGGNTYGNRNITVTSPKPTPSAAGTGADT